jgi:hypothetical protein
MSHEDKWDYEKGAMLPERKSAEQLFSVICMEKLLLLLLFRLKFYRRQSHFTVIVTHMSLRIIQNYSPPSLYVSLLYFYFLLEMSTIYHSAVILLFTKKNFSFLLFFHLLFIYTLSSFNRS